MLGSLSSLQSIKNIHLDYSSTSVAKFLHGTDMGPMCVGYPPFDATNQRHTGGPNVSKDMHDLNITLVRTHDSAVLDWIVNFPFPNLDADTTDPKNYDWTASDAWLLGVTENGFDPYLRLGTSFNQPGGALPPAGVDYNMTALVDVLLHTVMHYRDGWGSETWKAYPITYVEIWNEPDSSCDWSASESCGQFWNRTSTELADLVDATARALKAYDASLIVGADGCALPYAPWANPDPNPYSWGLIEEIAKRETPIDFFSWHYYTNNSDLMTEIAGAVRSKLDSVGLVDVEQHVTEWNICMNCGEQDTVRGAAATTATLTRMLEQKVSVATFYPACELGEGEETGHGWGLWDQDSQPGTALWRPMTYAYRYFGELMALTPAMLTNVVVDPNDDMYYTVLAGRSDGDESRMIRILLSTFESDCTSIAINIAGFDSETDEGSYWQFTVSVIDEEGSMDKQIVDPTEVVVADGAIALPVFDVAYGSSVIFVRLSLATAISY